MRIVVTGADGFVGSHVVDLAVRAGHEVHAIYRAMPATRRDDLGGEWAADLIQEWPIDETPDGVIHLASLAAVGRSFDAPQEYISANTAIMTNLGESLLRGGAGDTRVIVVSSGALYATAAEPCDERRDLAMTSPYAVSKAAVELQSSYYRARGLEMVVVRPFNHIGPGQARGFILPDLVEAVTGLGDAEALQVGNLDSRRDYTDVRDVARAYLDLLVAPAVQDIYNIASGVSVSGREILGEICHNLGREVPETIVDPARLRPNDPPEIIGDASRIRSDLGWTPVIPLQTSVRDFLTASTILPPE